MSQRILKCIICCGPHSIFHCNNKCGVCNGDNRECSCSEQPPKKKKRTAQSSSQSTRATSSKSSSQSTRASSAQSSSSDKELSKLYANLVKEHERVRLAFQNQQKEQEELNKDLDESNKDAEELANLVRTKSEAIQTLHTKLAQAKKTIAELKAELQTLRSSNEPQQQPQQQQQSSGRVSTHSLTAIHDRYENVLRTISENRYSMANAFRLTGCPRSTLRDFVAVAELKLIDSREYDIMLRDLQGGSVKELEAMCRRCLRRHLPVMAGMRREGKLLPLKFNARFYE